ncbi:MAG: hypothetical protein KME11_14785 [Timaviella obliquedivisa GSE-PSE-MK23-08B]|jgi:hypothetical protein|nr:hypothetical protein [Timaviella obliquedivisa GSE-PSE-MK23-08B]
MVSAIEQVERELNILNQAIASLAEEYYSVYSSYLSALGAAVRQQMILASYHVCTRGYPQQFLTLSLNQQQQLQRDLRHLAKQAQMDLAAKVTVIKPIDFSKVQTSNAEEMARSIAAHLLEMRTELDRQEGFANDDQSEFDELQAESMDLIDSVFGEPDEPNQPDNETEPGAQQANQELFAAIFRNESSDEMPSSDLPFDEARALIPKDLFHWQKDLEEKISDELQTLSQVTNRALQQADILPKRLPEPILEVASRADLSGESAAPNLLSLVIQTPSNQEASTTQVMAIRLRLSEIEFSDPMVLNGRSQIRKLSVRLAKLKREYQKKHRQKAIAQAEAAWRSSWYED